jgi:hypothetical protein
VQLKPFNSPSTLWPVIVIPLILLLFILNMISLITFIKIGALTQQAKFIFSIEIILMMAEATCYWDIIIRDGQLE